MWPQLTCLRHSLEVLGVFAELFTTERCCLLVVSHHFLAQMRWMISDRAGWECVTLLKEVTGSAC